jgi:hypothetical protein
LPRFASFHAAALVAFLCHAPSTDAQQASAFLPGGKLVPVIRANPREPAAGVKLVGVFQAATEFGAGMEGEAIVGHSLPLWLVSGESTDRATVLGIEGGVFGRFLLETIERDLISTDWTFAIPLIVWRGGSWYRFRYRHISSHLGDEYIERFEKERLDFSRDAFEVTVYRKLPAGFAAYAGGDFAVNVEPIGSERFRLLGGVEFAGAATNGSVQFFGGVDLDLNQDVSWSPRVNIQQGVRLFPENERNLSFVLEVAFGKSIQGEFHRENETVVMLGALLEL